MPPLLLHNFDHMSLCQVLAYRLCMADNDAEPFKPPHFEAPPTPEARRPVPPSYSAELRQLIDGMLAPDPSMRLTAEQAYDHIVAIMAAQMEW